MAWGLKSSRTGELKGNGGELDSGRAELLRRTTGKNRQTGGAIVENYQKARQIGRAALEHRQARCEGRAALEYPMSRQVARQSVL